MIVSDFHVIRVTSAPDKAHAPLIVDTDAVLTAAVSAQLFKAISGRRAKILNDNGAIQHPKFSQCHSL
jgi:hypothetical protein